MKRTFALTATIGFAVTVVLLPGGAGAAGAESGPGFVPQVSVPAPAPAAIAVPDPAAPPAPAAVTEAVTAVPVPLPGPVAAVVTPPSPGADDHMAELCAAREVFCQVDSSGHYIGS